jgi:hypothetical protein
MNMVYTNKPLYYFSIVHAVSRYHRGYNPNYPRKHARTPLRTLFAAVNAYDIRDHALDIPPV